jgi:two-component system, sensor histidine kinase and response regulator
MAKTMNQGGPTSKDQRQRSGGSSHAMDAKDALQRLGQDEELLTEIIQIYLEDSPAMLQAIHDAVTQADARSLQRAAHSLKGLSATLSAQPVATAAYRLEQMGATGNLSEAAAAVAQIEERVEELNAAVREFLKRHA